MLEPKTKYNLYKKLFVWSRKKFREAHSDLYKSDSICDNCKQWNSIIRVDYENFVLETNFGYMSRCGCCNKTTFWNCGVSMLPVVCDAKGTPLPDK